MLNIEISELVNTDASHKPNHFETSILPCKAMADSYRCLLEMMITFIVIILFITHYYIFYLESTSIYKFEKYLDHMLFMNE
jgi:hypothetical protein